MRIFSATEKPTQDIVKQRMILMRSNPGGQQSAWGVESDREAGKTRDEEEGKTPDDDEYGQLYSFI